MVMISNLEDKILSADQDHEQNSSNRFFFVVRPYPSHNFIRIYPSTTVIISMRY